MRMLPMFAVPLVGAALFAQTSACPQCPTVITAPTNDPAFGAAVFQAGALTGKTITQIGQFELRHKSQSDYYFIGTAWVDLGLGNSNDLLSGIYNLATNTFTDDGAIDGLNTAPNPGSAASDFQGSFNAQALGPNPTATVLVWDSDVDPTLGSSDLAYICSRPNDATPFNFADAVQISGVPTGDIDPHQAGRDAQGNMILWYADIGAQNGLQTTLTLARNDPANPWKITGATAGATAVVVSNGRAPGNASNGFIHSPGALQNSQGQPMAAMWSVWTGATATGSNGLFTPSVDNDGDFCILADGAANPYWMANPAVVGGTIIHAHSTGGTYIDGFHQEISCLANSDLSSGSGTIAAWSPARPAVGPVPSYISVVGIGICFPSGPYTIPNVSGMVQIAPTIGVLDIRFHDAYTGLAEWNFAGLPPLGGGNWEMQLITADISNIAIHASNTAVVTLP